MVDRKVTGAASRRDSILNDAREKGRQARAEGRSRESCPIAADDYPTRGARKAWLEGWDAETASQLTIKTQEAQVKVAPMEMKTRGGAEATFLPEGVPLPAIYSQQGPVPCEFCRALLLAGKTRAVILRGTDNGMAYFFCRNCREPFKRRLIVSGALGDSLDPKADASSGQAL
jgi:ribosome modulation factor